MSMLAKKIEAAARHRPFARGRVGSEARLRVVTEAQVRESERGLQVAVARERDADDADPYADVPCTD